jgi:hypothetical protein
MGSSIALGATLQQPKGDKEAAKKAIDKLAKLQKESDELHAKYLKLLAERQAAKDELKAAAPDLGCECDANYCHTEKKNEVITAGETDMFCHDDQDRGSVTIHCNSGEIEVIISTAIWSTFEELDRKRLRAGESWKRDIPEMSGWYDQTNRVEIVGKADSNYNLDFSSWDD